MLRACRRPPCPTSGSSQMPAEDRARTLLSRSFGNFLPPAAGYRGRPHRNRQWHRAPMRCLRSSARMGLCDRGCATAAVRRPAKRGHGSASSRNTPQNAPGRMIEPLVCEPSASGTIPAATAAADPDDEPPGVRSGSCGLRVLPGLKYANSVVTVLPTITAPAARNFETTVASLRGRRPASRGEPHSVGQSAVSMMSLTATGTPCSGPIGRPLLRH